MKKRLELPPELDQLMEKREATERRVVNRRVRTAVAPTANDRRKGVEPRKSRRRKNDS